MLTFSPTVDTSQLGGAIILLFHIIATVQCQTSQNHQTSLITIQRAVSFQVNLLLSLCVGCTLAIRFYLKHIKEDTWSMQIERQPLLPSVFLSHGTNTSVLSSSLAVRLCLPLVLSSLLLHGEACVLISAASFIWLPWADTHPLVAAYKAIGSAAAPRTTGRGVSASNRRLNWDYSTLTVGAHTDKSRHIVFL